MMLRGGDIIQDLASEDLSVQDAQGLACEVFSSMLEEWFVSRERNQRFVS